MIYAEITRPGGDPVFLPLLTDVSIGEKHSLAVLEMNKRPGVWRVWLDGEPVTDPIVLPGSHKHWQPIATAESWNGGVETCNGFGFRFERVGVAQSLGGSWRSSSPALRSATMATSCASFGPRPVAHGHCPSTRSRRTRSTPAAWQAPPPSLVGAAPDRDATRTGASGRDDLDGRPDADDLAQRDDVAVAEPDATV